MCDEDIDWRTPYLALKDGAPELFDAVMNSAHPDADRFSPHKNREW
jgi:hypothetical protein